MLSKIDAARIRFEVAICCASEADILEGLIDARFTPECRHQRLPRGFSVTTRTSPSSVKAGKLRKLDMATFHESGGTVRWKVSNADPAWKFSLRYNYRAKTSARLFFTLYCQRRRGFHVRCARRHLAAKKFRRPVRCGSLDRLGNTPYHLVAKRRTLRSCGRSLDDCGSVRTGRLQLDRLRSP
jgi:hypothetical protein